MYVCIVLIITVIIVDDDPSCILRITNNHMLIKRITNSRDDNDDYAPSASPIGSDGTFESYMKKIRIAVAHHRHHHR